MNIKNIIIALAIVFSGGSMVYAQAEQSGQAAQPAEKVNVGNKICPVSGEKVGEMGEIITYEYNGKIYNLCCDACKKDFVKNPEKFAKIAEDEVAAAQAAK